MQDSLQRDEHMCSVQLAAWICCTLLLLLVVVVLVVVVAIVTDLHKFCQNLPGRSIVSKAQCFGLDTSLQQTQSTWSSMHLMVTRLLVTTGWLETTNTG
jgi:predicted PurR-regulated permease PerM